MNDKDKLESDIRRFADEILHVCSETIRLDGLDDETYTLCDDLIKATLRYYRHRREAEDIGD